MVRLSQAIDSFGQPVRGAFPISDTVDAMFFTAAGVKTQTVPVGATFVRIRSTNTVYVNAPTAAAPGADITDGTASEAVGGLLPDGLYAITPGATLSVAATTATTVTLAFYA
jgi:hypothetical protein